MLLGFVDGSGRAYDVGFRTLRISLADREGFVTTDPGEEVTVQATATVSMDLLGGKTVTFLRPVRGEITATPRRVVFLAAKGLARTNPVTFFNISLALHPAAIQHFFTVQGGREVVQFEKGDITSVSVSAPAVEVNLRGPAPGKPGEMARYRLRVEPRSVGSEALAALG